MDIPKFVTRISLLVTDFRGLIVFDMQPGREGGFVLNANVIMFHDTV